MEQINITNCHQFFTEPLPNNGGYRWTLASLLGNILHTAEELFGQRDRSYTILGIELVAGGPGIWYPGDRKHIVIQLSLHAATNMFAACYEMAQETVHLLAPTDRQNVNNLEEGITIYFANLYMKEALNNPYSPPSDMRYRNALEAVTPTLDKDIDCVRRLREKEPSFSEISHGLISTECPNLTADEVDFLLSKFPEKIKIN